STSCTVLNVSILVHIAVLITCIPMSEEFIPNSEIYSAPPSSSAPTQPVREPIIITIIGSAIGIDLVIKILHRLGFAEARAWSKPQIDPNTGRPMRVLTKWLRY
ncbi:MAG: hypothetical protein ACFCVB_13305, partial [Nodosilinea sp.]